MSFRSEFAEVNGVRLHYLRWEGRGRPIVILHGNSHAGGVYAPLGERLAGDFPVVALDLRGHGLSAEADSYSWASLRDDTLALLDCLDLRDVVFVSHSRGGGVSLLAAAASDRVAGVVAYEPTVPLLMQRVDRPADWSSRLVDRALGRRSTFSSREDMFEHYRGRGAFAGWRDEFLHSFVEHGAIERDDGTVELACPTRVEAKLYEAMVDVSAWDDLGPCAKPLLLVYGERGGRVGAGRDPTAPVRELFPACASVILPECTHSGPMERPELFEQTIREFVGRL